MLPKTHFWASLVLATITFLVGWATPFQSFLIFFGGFLIDTDHYIWYVYNKKDWSLKKAYQWHYALYIKKEKRKCLHVFHTVESFLVIILISVFYAVFYYLFAGMAFHLLLDCIQAYQYGFYGKRISIISLLLKH